MSQPFPQTLPPRRRTPWGDTLTGLRRWYRRAFSRDSIADKIKTLVWVVPLTLLIWIYAEREQADLVSGKNTTLPITIRISAPNRIATLIQADQNVIADLSGPHRSLDTVLERHSRSQNPVPLEIKIESQISSGVHEVNTRVELSRIPELSSAGISVDNCRPDTLRFRVDDLVDRDVRVVAPPGITNLDAPPTFDPPTVHIRGPKSLFDTAEIDGKLVAVADLTGFDALRMPGPHALTNVPLTSPLHDQNVTLDRRTVNVSVHVKEGDVKLKLDSVPVFITMPQNLQDRFHVDYKPIIYNVTVSGPPDVIDHLRSHTLQPIPSARLKITNDDLPSVGQTRSRRLEFDLPDPSLHVAPEDAKQEWDFKLVERTAPEP